MSFDCIVVGLGAMGSAALYQLARAGYRVLGLDQYAPPHQLGSTHGETRITRLAVGEGAAYLPLVRRSHALWRELEAQTGEGLLYQGGGLVISPRGGGAGFHGPGDFALKSAALAREQGIPHQMLGASALQEKMPQLQIRPHEHAYFEPAGGVVRPEQAVATQLRLAQELGATLRLEEKVVGYEGRAGGVSVTSTRGQYQAGALILTAGPWIGELLPEALRRPLAVYRQVFYWFEPESLATFSLERFPWVIWIGAELADYFSVFPILPGTRPALKMVTEQYEVTTQADSVERLVSPAEIAHMHDCFVRRRLNGVTARCLAARVCLYTMTPDDHFLIDWHPEQPHVLLASPCSGHGFKHSAAVGEALAQLATRGTSDIDLSFFRLERLLSGSGPAGLREE